MYFRAERNPVSLFLILSILFFGMCFGTIQADSGPSWTSCPSQEGDGVLSCRMIRPPGRTAPVEQAFRAKSAPVCDVLPTLRHMSRRVSARFSRSGSFLSAVPAILFLVPVFFHTSRFYEGIQEITGRAVIIAYIHHQDGEKPHTPFFFQNRAVYCLQTNFEMKKEKKHEYIKPDYPDCRRSRRISFHRVYSNIPFRCSRI